MEHCEAEMTSGSLVTPVHEYLHGSSRNCIIGGYVYRGLAIPWLRGTYFFADNGSDEVFSFRYDPLNGVTELTNRTDELLPHPAVADSIDAPSSFGEDAFGELYILSYRDRIVYKVVHNIGAIPAASTWTLAGFTILVVTAGIVLVRVKKQPARKRGIE